MKKYGFILLVLLLALSISVDANARKKKKKKNKGDVEVVMPCTGPEFSTDKNFIRATGMGLSTDMNVAKKKAMADARSQIAMSIETKVKSVTDSYTSSYQMGENDETKQKFESLTRQSAKQTLSGLRIICDKMMRTPEGQYRAYVTIELAGEELVQGMANAIKSDDKLRLDFEYEKFKQVFDEEMSKTEE